MVEEVGEEVLEFKAGDKVTALGGAFGNSVLILMIRSWSWPRNLVRIPFSIPLGLMW